MRNTSAVVCFNDFNVLTISLNAKLFYTQHEILNLGKATVTRIQIKLKSYLKRQIL